ncbi:MAG: hypothetical protein HQL71_15695 [Magnetococcales bacterium]|nr:hypothetical protein [Magnetococcales bacterium]
MKHYLAILIALLFFVSQTALANDKVCNQTTCLENNKEMLWLYKQGKIFKKVNLGSKIILLNHDDKKNIFLVITKGDFFIIDENGKLLRKQKMHFQPDGAFIENQTVYVRQSGALIHRLDISREKIILNVLKSFGEDILLYVDKGNDSLQFTKDHIIDNNGKKTSIIVLASSGNELIFFNKQGKIQSVNRSGNFKHLTGFKYEPLYPGEIVSYFSKASWSKRKEMLQAFHGKQILGELALKYSQKLKQFNSKHRSNLVAIILKLEPTVRETIFYELKRKNDFDFNSLTFTSTGKDVTKSSAKLMSKLTAYFQSAQYKDVISYENKTISIELHGHGKKDYYLEARVPNFGSLVTIHGKVDCTLITTSELKKDRSSLFLPVSYALYKRYAYDCKPVDSLKKVVSDVKKLFSRFKQKSNFSDVKYNWPLHSEEYVRDLVSYKPCYNPYKYCQSPCSDYSDKSKGFLSSSPREKCVDLCTSKYYDCIQQLKKGH